MMLPNEDCFSKNFTKMEILGRGVYGDVYKVKCIKTGSLRALKKLKQKEGSQQNGIDPITLREIVILNDLNSKYVVRLIDVFRENINILLLFEYMKGDLNSLISPMIYNNKISNNFNFTLTFKELIKTNLIDDKTLISKMYNFLIQSIFKQLIEGL